MIPLARDIENCEKGRRLSGGRQHCRSSSFKRRDLGGHHIVRRVLKTRIKIALRLQVEQFSHRLAAVISEGCALDNRNHARITIPRRISRLNAFCFFSHRCVASLS